MKPRTVRLHIRNPAISRGFLSPDFRPLVKSASSPVDSFNEYYRLNNQGEIVPIITSPWFPVYAGIVSIFIYSIGQYGRIRRGEILKTIGMAGTGLVLLRMFWGTCAVNATIFAIILLGAAIAARVLIALYYLIFGAPSVTEGFSFDNSRRRDTSSNENSKEKSESLT
jgi:hypothetical protein